MKTTKEFYKELSLTVLVEMAVSMMVCPKADVEAVEINLIDDEIKAKAKELGMSRGHQNQLVVDYSKVCRFKGSDGKEKVNLEIPIGEVLAFTKWLNSLNP